MLQEKEFEKQIWRARWPIIIAALAIFLIVVQIVRVNRNGPQSDQEVAAPVKYTGRGPLVNGNVTIGANGFYSTRIELNRRTKVSGSFRTPNIRSRVSILVLSESNFANWSSAQPYQAVAETGQVPGGKINAGLEPGVYFLVIDNRPNGAEQSVYTDFSVD